MRKILAVAGAVLAPLSVSLADGGLVPSDIVPQGRWDASVAVNADSNSYDIRFTADPGRRTSDKTGESLQVRYGLGNDFHVGAQLNHASRWVTRSDYLAPPAHFENRSREGGQNPLIWVKYGFVNDPAGRFLLSGEIQASPNTSGKQPSSYMARLSAAWKADETLLLYGTGSGRVYNGSSFADSSTFTFGLQKRLFDGAVLIPEVGHTRFQPTATYSSVEQKHAALALQLRLTQGIYLIPGVAFYRNTSAHSFDGLFRQGEARDGRNVSLALFYRH